MVERVGAEAIVMELAGELDLHAAPRLRAELDRSLDRHPGRDLVLDLSRVTFIDSSGLGVLLGRHRRLEPTGRHLVLAGVSPGIRDVLTVAGLTHVLAVRDQTHTGEGVDA